MLLKKLMFDDLIGVCVCVCVQLAGASGNSVLLTQQERERIEELLRDLEEEHSDPELLTEPQVHTHTHTHNRRERENRGTKKS